jgi:hypothetical protein
MYHIHPSFSGETLTYVHLFKYTKVEQKNHMNLATVEESLFRFGRPKVSFQRSGETIHVSDKEPHNENLNILVRILIVTFFETEIQGEVQ